LRQARELLFDSSKATFNIRRRGECTRARASRRQSRIVPPPVESDLFGFIDRTHKQSDLDREKLHVGQIDLDVAGDHEAFVQDPIENVDQAM